MTRPNCTRSALTSGSSSTTMRAPASSRPCAHAEDDRLHHVVAVEAGHLERGRRRAPVLQHRLEELPHGVGGAQHVGQEGLRRLVELDALAAEDEFGEPDDRLEGGPQVMGDLARVGGQQPVALLGFGQPPLEVVEPGEMAGEHLGLTAEHFAAGHRWGCSPSGGRRQRRRTASQASTASTESTARRVASGRRT